MYNPKIKLFKKLNTSFKNNKVYNFIKYIYNITYKTFKNLINICKIFNLNKIYIFYILNNKLNFILNKHNLSGTFKLNKTSTYKNFILNKHFIVKNNINIFIGDYIYLNLNKLYLNFYFYKINTFYREVLIVGYKLIILKNNLIIPISIK